ncbi:MAG: hypothetical protein AAGA39_00705 [Pseudomonadota bacterium]
MAAPVLLLSFRSFPGVTSAYAVPALVGFALSPSLSRPPDWAIALGGLVAYALFSVLWTPQGGAASWVWWQPTLFLVGLFVFQQPRPPVHMLTIGLSLALALLFMDAITGSGIRAIIPPENRPDKDVIATARGLGILMMMMPFLVLALWRWGGISSAMGAVLAFLVAALSLPVEANVLAAFLGIAGAALALWRPLVAFRAVIASAGLALAFPFVLALTLPPVSVLAGWSSLSASSLHRLIIWRTLLDEWLAGQPLFGAGARATRALSRDTGRLELSAYGIEVSQVSVHPHNVPIEVLFEYGLVGYSLLLAAFVAGARAILAARWDRQMAAAMVALTTIIVVIFSIQTTMWNVYFSSATLLTVYALYGLSGERAR